MSNRSKVGQGNRKIVRQHFRENGIELPYGRDCVNNRYSFKASDGYLSENGAFAGLMEDVLDAACTCPVSVTLHRTLRRNTYTRMPQHNIAVRFEDQ